MTTTVRPEVLAAEVAAASRAARSARALVLDVDGTLAPIAARPQDARIPGETLAALGRLVASGWRLALVSGRAATQLPGLVGGVPAATFGSHGLEGPSDRAFRLDPLQRQRIDRWVEAVESLATAWPGVEVERKPAGIAVHDRGVAPTRVSTWRRRLKVVLALEDLGGFEILRGRRVVEIRLAGENKGRVARVWEPAREADPDDPTVVAAGDDRTDEDLFAALGRGATTVRVGRFPAASLARWRLPSPVAMGRFLGALATLQRREAS